MVLYKRISLPAFVESLERTAGTSSSFTLSAIELMHEVPREEVDYGLSLLRESIGLYEESEGIPAERGKRAIPFFREGSRMLVGPEMGMYVIPLHERLEAAEAGCDKEPHLVLELDYRLLGEHCLLENYALSPCKYDKESVIRHFMELLKTEYDTFFFDEEHTGFKPGSRFFSMLCEAALEVKPASSDTDKEWRLAVWKSPEEVSYRYGRGTLLPYAPLEFPLECLRHIHLCDRERHPLLFGALIGLLKSKGLPAEQLLNLT